MGTGLSFPVPDGCFFGLGMLGGMPPFNVGDKGTDGTDGSVRTRCALKIVYYTGCAVLGYGSGRGAGAAIAGIGVCHRPDWGVWRDAGCPDRHPRADGAG